ncbi:hypothetical protein CHS0354_041645, partial [Potamilus streckersoni]
MGFGFDHITRETVSDLLTKTAISNVIRTNDNLTKDNDERESYIPVLVITLRGNTMSNRQT